MSVFLERLTKDGRLQQNPKMIDTIRFRTNLQPKPDLKKTGEWTETPSTSGGNTKGVSFRRLVHTNSKLRLLFDDRTGWSVEVSLPRVLFGDNERILKSQRDIDEALQKLDSLIRSATTFYAGCEEFRRVDLCWSIPGNGIRAWIEVLWMLSPREFGGKVIIYRGESITWESKRDGRHKKPALRLLMYDKKFEKTGRYRDGAIRVELQLQGNAAAAFVAQGGKGGKKTSPLDFKRCYTHLREVLLRFEDCDMNEVETKAYKGKAKDWMEDYGVSFRRSFPANP